MNEMLKVAAESRRADRRAFLTLPYRLYRHHPLWVPPLRGGERATFDRRRNPFFEHADVQHFLARRGRSVVGRIAAIENRLHNETFGDRVGFFGFFDAEPDAEAAQALVDAAAAWLGARHLDRMRGPVNYSTNDTCGVLVDGFDEPPTVLMPYNRPDYDALLLGTGLVGAKDLLAFWIPNTNQVPERLRRVVTRRVANSGVTIRPFDLRNLDGEITRLKDVYNRCWADNWGFVPATEAEFRFAAGHLKMLLEPTLSGVAEKDGAPIGISLILRDVNVLLRGTSGRLTPRVLFRLLFRLPTVQRMRVVALGVVPEFRGRGVTEALILRAGNSAIGTHVQGGEAGWILEDNEKMQSSIRFVGGRVTKRYRIYDKAL